MEINRGIQIEQPCTDIFAILFQLLHQVRNLFQIIRRNRLRKCFLCQLRFYGWNSQSEFLRFLFPLFESENCLLIIYSEAVIFPCCLAELEVLFRLKESVIILSVPAVPAKSHQRGLVIVVAHELVSAHFDTFGLWIFTFWLQCPILSILSFEDG